ncbi:MAG TPA: DUF362 domain-containing protein [Terracidiphilus sp.]|nr:DUF362 domain-containing protein [Terracidiphilus sp.]
MGTRMLRRTFLKTSAIALGGAAVGDFRSFAEAAQKLTTPPDKSQVFFTDDISVNGLLKIYSRINQDITGKVAIKLHSGEPHGPNLLPIELIRGLQPTIANSTIVECNVLYPSPRQKTDTHRETIQTNGFDFCPVDIMDAEGDTGLPIPGMRAFLDGYSPFDGKQPPYTPGTHLTEISVGKNLLLYDSLLVYTHFKGHTMGGFGGSLKNIAIGCASGAAGKRQIHGDGWPKGSLFLERMVESGKGIVDHFSPHIAYINVLKNISVDCDCDAHGAKPTCNDIGIVGSRDILAVDKASTDLVYSQPELQRHDIVERIESRGGLHQLEYMKTLQMGDDAYELITL